MICAYSASQSPGHAYQVIPVIPWLPAIPWLAYAFGLLLVACGAGLLRNRTARLSSLVLGGVLMVSALVLDVPKSLAHPGNMSLRTGVFEPLAIASIAWLLPGLGAGHLWRNRISRYLLMTSLVVFGVDHLIALEGIGSLIPSWIPWHVFWVAFFGVGFIGAGLSFGFEVQRFWAGAGLGLMFCTWVLTLHFPRVMGWYGIPGAGHNPNEWESLFIAVALWGGFWALTGAPNRMTLPEAGDRNNIPSTFRSPSAVVVR
jgi:hypothetical protein